MGPDRDDPTDPEVPRPRRRFPTLSDIRLDKPSLPPPADHDSTPPDATEAERLWQAVASMDQIQRAHAASFLAFRKAEAERHERADVELVKADAERMVSRLKAWAILIAAVLGGIASVIAAFK